MCSDGHLYWSRKGEIACGRHAPARESERWTTEGWLSMPDLGSRMAKYQCQHCEGGPLKAFPRPAAGMPLILNVDDRPASLYVRNRALRTHGFVVANAANGREALEFARRLQPQLVLLDVHLPDIDGRDVCRLLKNDAETAAIPVMLISATLGERGEALEGRGPIAADGFVAEPVDAGALALAVRQLLKGGLPQSR